MGEPATDRGTGLHVHGFTSHGSTLRVVILSDIRLLREGLAASLVHRRGIEVLETLAPSPAAVARIAGSGATILLLDTAAPAAFDVLKEIIRRPPGIKVIAIATDETEHELLMCAEAGVAGYVTRDSSVSDLVMAMESALRGEVMCPPRIAAVLVRCVASRSASTRETAQPEPLTRREREIVTLLAEHLSNKAIARRLAISAATVKNHVHNILEKLQVRCRDDAVAWLRNERDWHTSNRAGVPRPSGRSADTRRR